MARRPERNFFEQLKRNLPKVGVPLHLQRIENTAGVGTPDVNYCLAGREGWAELKAWERIRFTGRFTVPKFRAEQAAWLYARSSAGGRAYLVCRINRDVALFDGRLAPALFDKELHLDWAHGASIAHAWLKPPIDWKQLAHALMTEPDHPDAVQVALGLFRRRLLQPKTVDL